MFPASALLDSTSACLPLLSAFLDFLMFASLFVSLPPVYRSSRHSLNLFCSFADLPVRSLIKKLLAKLLSSKRLLQLRKQAPSKISRQCRESARRAPLSPKPQSAKAPLSPEELLMASTPPSAARRNRDSGQSVAKSLLLSRLCRNKKEKRRAHTQHFWSSLIAKPSHSRLYLPRVSAMQVPYNCSQLQAKVVVLLQCSTSPAPNRR